MKKKSTRRIVGAEYHGSEGGSRLHGPAGKRKASIPHLQYGVTGAHPYQGRQAALATKHGKLAQIGPALLAAVSLDVIPVDLDTDLFGTFTGEIARPGDALQTAIAKAQAAAHAGALPLGVASEGSFGPHPASPFVSANLEIVVLVDLSLGCHIAEKVLTTNTNFAHIRLRPDQPPDEFARNVGFPAHALVVQPSIGPGQIIKGITNGADLIAAIAVSAEASSDGQALVQTDMRAHYNPTRQLQIAEAANRLGQRLACLCPECGTPGWGQIETIPGLPCEICGSLTNLTGATVNGCPSCPHRETHDVDSVAEARYCLLCNP